jgi:HK97 family phage prohead protease
MRNLEHKYLEEENKISDIDIKKRVISGYLSQVEIEDKGNDIIEKTAFTKTLQERKNDIYFLNQHDFTMPHGKFAELEVDNYGLKFVSNPLPNTTYSNDTLELIEKGIIGATSIGYITTKEEFKGNTRIIKELKLYEGSTVTVPMNDGAIITGLKTLTLKEIKAKEAKILKAFRHGKFTDDTFTLLELALKDLQSQAYELGKKEALKQSDSFTQQKSLRPEDVDRLINNFKF